MPTIQLTDDLLLARIYRHVGINRPYDTTTVRVIDVEAITDTRASYRDLEDALDRLVAQADVKRPTQDTVILTESGVVRAAAVPGNGAQTGYSLIAQLGIAQPFTGSDGFFVGRLSHFVGKALHWATPSVVVVTSADVAPLRSGEQRTDSSGPGFAIDRARGAVRGVYAITMEDRRELAIDASMQTIGDNGWQLRIGELILDYSTNEVEFLEKICQRLTNGTPG